MKPSRSRFLEVRGLRLHVREWGAAEAPQLFLLHGWGDASATFQFLVDALVSDWHVIAPDWRGFGLSECTTDAFWFPDYLADLDALLAHYSPDQPARLVGHSMGGNVACLYAGVRPARVAAVVALDAFGLPERPLEETPGRLEKWLRQLEAPQGFRRYATVAAFAERLVRDNPRLTPERAAFFAGHFSRPDGQGGVTAAIVPAHRNVNPIPYRRAEAEQCWRRVTAPVMWIVQADPAWRRALGLDDATYRAGAACFRDFREVEIAESGHNLHHDQPQRVAMALEAFLRTLES